MTDDEKDNPPPSIADRLSKHQRELILRSATDGAGIAQRPTVVVRDIFFSTRTEADLSHGDRVTIDLALPPSGSEEDIDELVRKVAEYARSLGARPFSATVQAIVRADEPK